MTLIYKDDIGAHLVIETNNTSIPVTTVVTILITKPSGTVLTKTPSIINYMTGQLTYDTASGDLDESGTYKVQVNGVFDDGDDLRSNMDTFTVFL